MPCAELSRTSHGLKVETCCFPETLSSLWYKMFSFPVFLFTPPDSGMLGRVRWGRMAGSVTSFIKRCTFSIMLTSTYLRHSFPQYTKTDFTDVLVC